MSRKIEFTNSTIALPLGRSALQAFTASPRENSSPIIYLAVFGLIVALSVVPFLGHPSLGPLERAPNVASTFGRLPLVFVPNQGQTEATARFEARGMGGTLTFGPQEILLTLPTASNEQNPETIDNSGQTLRLSFIDANPVLAVEGGKSLPGTANYYLGSDSARWYTNLPTYADIKYRHLYAGIDLSYEGTDGQLKSTFIVAPGADPTRIRWQYRGAEAVTLDSATGNLQIELAEQTQVVEQAPVAWQQIRGRRVPVPVAYAVAGDHSIGFALGSYDVTAPLTIDPTIVYESVIGGATSGIDIAVDAARNAYVIARAYDTNNDVMVAKLSADGALQYTTYLRGSSGDFGTGIALDGSGDVYITGGTDSSDFPILNAMQSVKNGVTRDAFIAKLAAQDGSLQFSTYFGGSRSDIIQDIALNSAGQIYLVGYTESTDFPTLDPIQGGLNLNQCFCEDVFVAKLSPDALTVLYGTYLGGSFEDYGQSIALDGNDNMYITGRTQSDDFPTQAAIQPNRAGQYQDEDVFVAKITADGGSLVYSTYLGGDNLDRVRRIAVDDAGNAYLAGTTRSANFPTTSGAFQEQFAGGINECGTTGFGGPRDCDDMFVTKLVPDGSALAYSTYLGGGLDEAGDGVAVDSSGRAIVVGYTQSADFPPDGGASGLDADIVAAKLNASGSDLLYTVRIDSPVANSSHGIATDAADDIYITGAQNVPGELYVAKISDDGAPPPSNQPPVAVASANPESGAAPLSVQFSSDGSNDPDGTIVTYAWDFGDGDSSTEANPSHTYNSAGTFDAILTVTDDYNASQSDTVVITVNALNTAPTVSITAPADGSSFNEGNSISFTGTASDAEDGDLSASLSWSSDVDGPIGTGGSFSTASLSAGTHTIIASVTDSGGLGGSDQIVITVTDASQDELHVQDQTVTRRVRGKRARGIDRVLITDQNNQPVGGATVTAVYSGPNQGQVSGVTGDDGVVALRTKWVRNPQGVWCFEITNVSKDGYVYNPAANVVTVQCE